MTAFRTRNVSYKCGTRFIAHRRGEYTRMYVCTYTQLDAHVYVHLYLFVNLETGGTSRTTFYISTFVQNIAEIMHFPPTVTFLISAWS